MAFAISFMRIVLPVLGCATIRARCPFPMGEKRSTMRVLGFVVARSPQRLNFSSGKSGVRCSNDTLSRTSDGLRPLILFTVLRAKYFSFSCGGRTWQSTTSPVFSPYFFICCGEHQK